MALAPGIRLGPYEIVALLGAGGMGEVYRAADKNLGREVAIKVLPDEFAQDAERLARFEREAKTLASLSHPNIAIVHGLEETGSIRALVMELVDGPTLADRIAHGPIPLEEAQAIAREIAEALSAAHEQGIIHRDLKPANIKVRPDGTVKVLDFGLAKTVEPAGPMSPGRSLSPTLTTPVMTQAGVILGSAAYMAPEQAKGRAADKRCDIWAFGCVFYEMLAGKRAFDGEDVSDTLASVLRGEPDWHALPADVPLPIVALIKRSLEKDRRKRIGDIAAALFVLTEPPGRSQAPPIVTAGVTTRFQLAAVGLTLVVGALAAAGGWWIGARSIPSEPKPVTRFMVPLGADEFFSTFGGNLIALSPDGRHLVYHANNRLNLRSLDRLEPAPIRGTESGLPTQPAITLNPFFSPDGQWIGFRHDGQIKKIAVGGGAHVAIAPAPNASAFSWEDDGTILFGASDAIWRVPDSGGEPEKLVDGLIGRVQSLQMLPGKRALLYTLFPIGSLSRMNVVVRSLETGHEQVLSGSGIEAHYLPTGHIVYVDAGTLLAVPFDLQTLTPRGAPVPVAEGIASSSAPTRAISAAHVAISRSGTLAYVTGIGDSGLRTLVWVDRAGREQPITGLPDRSYVYPRLAPDGSRVALTVGDQDRDIWIWDFARANLRRFTTDAAEERYAIWTPDGGRILFGSTRGGEAGTWWQPADGSGVPERLASFPLKQFNNFVPTTVSPDGSRVVVTATTGTAAGPPDLWTFSLTGERRPEQLLATTSGERNAEISPDGRWLAYESIDNDQADVWVRPFPDVNSGKWEVSTGGGSQPLWARDGKELFFRDAAGALMSVAIHGQAPLALATPAKILDGPYVYSIPTYAGRLYDISPDGKRFLMLKRSSGRDQATRPSGITVVQNWLEEVKRLAPPK